MTVAAGNEPAPNPPAPDQLAAASAAEESPQPRRAALRAHVAARATYLQEAYLRQESGATATLAHLRHAVGAEPGSVPAVWRVTLEDLDPRLVGRGDEPTPAERAVHAALCLFAVHQQSQRTGMHASGVGVGRAVRRLAQRKTTQHTDGSKAVERRFHALGTSTSFAEALHHARGLVGQLRAEDIPLDYGQLAVDLQDLQDPARAERVRLRWGRDYYRTGPADPANPSESQSATASQPTTENEPNGEPQ